MRPGDKVVFELVSAKEAVEALNALESVQLESCHSGENKKSGTSKNADAARIAADPLYALSNHNEDYWKWMLDYTDGNIMGTEVDFALHPRTGDAMRSIDLNADCGEGFDDEGLLKYVTSANISCGAHAGDAHTIASTIRLAAARGVAIGAHVSYPDRENFGRVVMDMPPAELRSHVLSQVGSLQGLCAGIPGARVSYIKFHGALYHTVMSGSEQGQAVVDTARNVLKLPLLLMPTSPAATYGEGFAERAYDGDVLRSG